MSTTPNQPPAGDSPLSKLLAVLFASNEYVTLGVTVAGVAIPLIKGLIAKIEGIGTGNVTIAFSDLVAADLAELDAIQALSTDDLTAVNAELARMGFPTLPAPPPPGNPPITQ
jgi:hypothetical protein